MLTIAGLRYFRNLIIAHRLEWPLPVNALCYSTWGSLYAVSSVAELASLTILAATLANGLLFTSGLALNSLVDVPTDERHEDKSYQAAAVRELGREHVALWAATEAAVGIALLAWVTLTTGHWMSLTAGLTVVALQGLYNVPPAHLKARGFAGAAAYGAAVATTPCLLSYWAVRPDLDITTCLIFFALGVLSAGRTAWWSVPDHHADAAAGLNTPSVLHGRHQVTLASCATMAVGLAILDVGLWWRFGPALAALGISAHVVVLLVAFAPSLARQSQQVALDSRRFRTRILPLVALGEAAIATVPLVQIAL
ncbi:UbiA family prenyltransferase [Amycolatopsis sp. NPDC059657]|uniref:UbiA family prenyltransferase n=1 Tax=Amycolatopsis sp. NPDC059657 TaxID=3346899 RepID=UPI003673574F